MIKKLLPWAGVAMALLIWSQFLPQSFSAFIEFVQVTFSELIGLVRR